MLPAGPGWKNAVEPRRDQSVSAIEQRPADRIQARHRAQRPDKRGHVQRLPIILSRHFENCRVSPKKQRWLALDRIDVRPAAIDNLVRDDRIDCFINDWLRMEQRWKSGTRLSMAAGLTSMRSSASHRCF